MKKGAPKVTIAIPNLGTVHVKLMMILIRWMSQDHDDLEKLALITPKGLVPHDNARNFCVKEFLKTDSTHLFFIDSDVVPPYNALRKLLSHDKEVITGCYPSMRFDSEANKELLIYNVFRHVLNEKTGVTEFKNIYGEGLEEIESAGAGCLLIKREVLERMENNWFRWQYDDVGFVTYGEDISFFNRCKEMGIQAYADFDVTCKHSKTYLL